MAGKGKSRIRQRRWRFSDTSNRFDGKRRIPRRSAERPISPALKRGIVYCKRCRSRVVSNVEHCPFCGKSLRPFFARLWFWLIIVVVVALATIWIVNINLPEESTTPSKPSDPARPTVVGQTANSTYKSLSIGTAIDNEGLRVKVNSVEVGPPSSDGSAILVAIVEFDNQRDAPTTLYSTQWMLEAADGTRIDTFVGTAADGTTITSNFEAYELAGGGRFVGRLYFAANNAIRLVYQPSALSYSEDLLVTWQLESP
ncbi:MAG: zinc ribbon domain-containing protein [Coriobacteriales bacterium]|nr:zinc ribbon domain-containing protein [Coriobacteriales bacterium]